MEVDGFLQFTSQVAITEEKLVNCTPSVASKLRSRPESCVTASLFLDKGKNMIKEGRVDGGTAVSFKVMTS